MSESKEKRKNLQKTSQIVQTYTIPGTYEVIVPKSVGHVVAELWGGGGGGSGATPVALDPLDSNAGNAGGAGGYIRATVEIKKNSTLTITVGAGGVGGAPGINGAFGGVPGGNGGAGGNSTLIADSSILTAGGGGGGGIMPGTVSIIGTGGSANVVGIPFGFFVAIPGQNGSPFGGGGSASSGGDGGFSGASGASPLVLPFINGTSGIQPGGGGGAAGVFFGDPVVNGAGGSGANGSVYITYNFIDSC